MMSQTQNTRTVREKLPYVPPEIIDYGDGREATKSNPAGVGGLDGAAYNS
jgi:hypothetical protein